MKKNFNENIFNVNLRHNKLKKIIENVNDFDCFIKVDYDMTGQEEFDLMVSMKHETFLGLSKTFKNEKELEDSIDSELKESVRVMIDKCYKVLNDLGWNYDYKEQKFERK